MRITIYGTGYVGLVTGACLAESGNHVLCVDIDEDRVARLNAGEVPIFEPGLDGLIERNRDAGRIRFSTEVGEGVAHGLFQFICVGTPEQEDGSADLRYVLAAARSIAEHMSDYRIIVCKSTVPVGTADRVQACVREVLDERGVNLEADVVSNPEFLKEGAAIEDFMKPDRIVVGTDNPRTAELLKTLYEPFNRNHERMIVMDVRSSELTKYAANAMLAAKISFMNELALVAERFGADIERIRAGIGSDPRIGYHFIYPGAGYGGSCFPKDIRALIHTASHAGVPTPLLQAVDKVNTRQKRMLFDKIFRRFDGRLAGLTVALWGLAFKPNTDDVREASSRVLMEMLWDSGARVQAFDPQATAEVRKIYGERDDLLLCRRAEQALDGADALVVMTEWQEFRSPDFERIRETLRHPVIFDGRNLYDPELLQRMGIEYYAIGRGKALAPPALGGGMAAA